MNISKNTISGVKTSVKAPIKTLAGVVMTAWLVAGCAGGPGHRSTGEAVDDSVLTARVKTALVENDQTKARQIDIEVYRGEVQLNGFVDSTAAKNAAATTAKNVPGVQAVRNNLKIRDADRSVGAAVDDSIITTRVKAALVGDPRTKVFQVEVKTNAGVVQLGGFVDTVESKRAAGEVARGVDGVESVSNGLEVRK